jgi:hypothetical protein
VALTSIFKSLALETNHLRLDAQNPPLPDAIYNCDDNRTDRTGNPDSGNKPRVGPANPKKRTQSTGLKSIYINGRTQQVIENSSAGVKDKATNSQPGFFHKTNPISPL